MAEALSGELITRVIKDVVDGPLHFRDGIETLAMAARAQQAELEQLRTFKTNVDRAVQAVVNSESTPHDAVSVIGRLLEGLGDDA